MTEITQFVAMPFDLVDGDFVAVEPIVCASPALAIQTAQGQWKFFGHAGAVAFSRTNDFEKGNTIAGMYCAGLGRCQTNTWAKMMANEFRIAALLFCLSTSAALAQDLSAGETSFRKCRACHSVGVGARNGIGPLLNGIDDAGVEASTDTTIQMRTGIAPSPGTRLSLWTTSKIQN